VPFVSGTFHSISNNSVIEGNTGWGIHFSSGSLDGIQISGSAIQDNILGGIQFVGTNHLASNCLLVLNGSTESSDHRSGAIFGSSTTAATSCRIDNSTLAGNIPWGAKRVFGSSNEIQENETYLNDQLGIRVLVAQPQPSLNHFVVDDVNELIVLRGSVVGSSNTSVEVEFFVPIDSTNQGAAYLDTADLNVQLDGNGNGSFYHKFDRDAVFDGVALLPQPLSFTIDEEDTIVVTATSSTSGTSEFSNPAFPTLPGDFDLDGDVDGRDFFIWQRNFGNQDAEYWQGDADFDGDVDGDDKEIWEQNFGQTP